MNSREVIARGFVERFAGDAKHALMSSWLKRSEEPGSGQTQVGDERLVSGFGFAAPE